MRIKITGTYIVRGIIIAVAVLIGLTLFAEPKDADRSLMTQLPCAPPCWYGLELEKSTQDNVLNTLSTLPFVEKNSFSSHIVSDSKDEVSIIYGCTYEFKQSHCGSFWIKDDKLSSIIYQLGYKLTFKEVVDLYGAPDSILSMAPIAPPGGCTLGIFWSAYSLHIEFSDFYNDRPCRQMNEEGTIDPKLKVRFVMIDADEMSVYEPNLVIRSPWADNFQKK